MAKSSEETIRDMVAKFKDSTGKTLEEWKVVIGASGLQKHGELVKMIKEQFGVGHGYANMIVHEAQQTYAAALSQTVDLEAEWYQGDKGALKPIHDKIMGIILAFGEDIEQTPKKAYMGLRRSKQFACVGPGSKTRIDLQIQLKGTAATARLEEVKGGMTSHRVKISTLDEVDSEVVAWLRQAYHAAV